MRLLFLISTFILFLSIVYIQAFPFGFGQQPAKSGPKQNAVGKKDSSESHESGEVKGYGSSFGNKPLGSLPSNSGSKPGESYGGSQSVNGGSVDTFDETFEPRKCKLSAFVQGNIKGMMAEDETVFLTVHDIGKNHLSFVRFVNSPPMAAIKERGVFVHVCVPGQEPDAEDLDEDFPSTEILSHALAELLETLKLNKCVVIGEGAGADIACRFAMNHHKMVSALLLIHCTSTTHGIVENIKEIFTNLILEDGEMTHSAWNYLLTHRFGNHKHNEHHRHFMEGIKTEWRLNPHNLSRYIYSFSNRLDFTNELKDGLATVDTMLVTGGKSAHNENVRHMFDNMDKSKAGMLVAEGCADVMEEAPEYLVTALVLLCHRNKLLGDVQLYSNKNVGNIQPTTYATDSFAKF